MRAISVQQPWAQLIADRRRHVMIKTWRVQPGERFALHASHIRKDELCKKFGYDPERCTKNAILAIIEVRKCIPWSLARPSKFDAPNKSVERKPEYAIAVRTIEKFRKPIEENPPAIREPIWQSSKV